MSEKKGIIFIEYDKGLTYISYRRIMDVFTRAGVTERYNVLILGDGMKGHVFEHDLLKQKISQFLQDWHKHADGFTVQDVYIEEDCADLMADGIIKLFTPIPESPETHKDSD